MFLEIITPQEKVFEGEVVQATFPGADGSFQVLNNHTSMISILGKGDIKYQQEKEQEMQILVEGGVVEVSHNLVSVLVEKIFEE